MLYQPTRLLGILTLSIVGGWCQILHSEHDLTDDRFVCDRGVDQLTHSREYLNEYRRGLQRSSDRLKRVTTRTVTSLELELRRTERNTCRSR